MLKIPKNMGQVFGHIGELTQGSLKVGQTVNAIVDAERRHSTSLNQLSNTLIARGLYVKF